MLSHFYLVLLRKDVRVKLAISAIDLIEKRFGFKLTKDAVADDIRDLIP